MCLRSAAGRRFYIDILGKHLSVLAQSVYTYVLLHILGI